MDWMVGLSGGYCQVVNIDLVMDNAQVALKKIPHRFVNSAHNNKQKIV